MSIYSSKKICELISIWCEFGVEPRNAYMMCIKWLCRKVRSEYYCFVSNMIWNVNVSESVKTEHDVSTYLKDSHMFFFPFCFLKEPQCHSTQHHGFKLETNCKNCKNRILKVFVLSFFKVQKCENPQSVVSLSLKVQTKLRKPQSILSLKVQKCENPQSVVSLSLSQSANKTEETPKYSVSQSAKVWLPSKWCVSLSLSLKVQNCGNLKVLSLKVQKSVNRNAKLMNKSGKTYLGNSWEI